MAKPSIFLETKEIKNLKRYFGNTEIEKYFTIDDLSNANKDAIKKAQSAAKKLDGLIYSSDTDCEFIPVVLNGAHPLTKEFFEQFGIKKREKVTVAGYENLKLKVISSSKKHHYLEIFSNLDDDIIKDEEELEEYISKEEQNQYASCFKLMNENIFGIRLYIGDCIFLQLTLCEVREQYAGVLVLSVET